MKLIDFIPVLLDREKISSFYKQLGLDEDEDYIGVYMLEKIDIDSEIEFFSREETDDFNLFRKGGRNFISLFEVDHLADLIEDDLQLKDRNYSNSEIAKRLIDYRINDA